MPEESQLPVALQQLKSSIRQRITNERSNKDYWSFLTSSNEGIGTEAVISHFTPTFLSDHNRQTY